MGINMTVTLLVKISGKAGHGKALAEVLNSVPAENDIDGCFGMDVFMNNENPDEALIVEKWSSIETHKSFLAGLIEAGGLDEMLKHVTEVNRTYYEEVNE
jgi:heme-degrading monooxygenase HmoA